MECCRLRAWPTLSPTAWDTSPHSKKAVGTCSGLQAAALSCQDLGLATGRTGRRPMSGGHRSLRGGMPWKACPGHSSKAGQRSDDGPCPDARGGRPSTADFYTVPGPPNPGPDTGLRQAPSTSAHSHHLLEHGACRPRPTLRPEGLSGLKIDLSEATPGCRHAGRECGARAAGPPVPLTRPRDSESPVPA